MANNFKELNTENLSKPDIKSNKEIRLLILITRMTIGGDTNVVLDLADYFNKNPQFKVQLAVGPVPEHELDLSYLADERGINTKIIPSLVNHITPMKNLKAVLELRALMRQEKFDIVHTHSSVAGIVGRLAAFTTRTPVIVHHIHGWGVNEYMSKLMKLVYLNLERLFATFTNRLIAVSKANIQKGLAYRICKKEKFSLIYNGINLEKFRKQVDRPKVILDLGLDPECKIVGMIGRLDQQKNPLDFIQAAAFVLKDYRKVQFVIAGEGLLRPECEKLIKDLHLENNFFLLGFRNDIDQIMPSLTITAMSSLWEGLPVVFQEAMSVGIPIVANNVDGASDVVINGKTGYLVTPHEPQEMADRILYLLKNEQLCSEMSHESRKHSERFSTEQMLKETEALYRALLESSGN